MHPIRNASRPICSAVRANLARRWVRSALAVFGQNYESPPLGVTLEARSDNRSIRDCAHEDESKAG
jgi:hypothetical protein